MNWITHVRNAPRVLPVLACILGALIATSMTVVGSTVLSVLGYSLFLATITGWQIYRIVK